MRKRPIGDADASSKRRFRPTVKIYIGIGLLAYVALSTVLAQTISINGNIRTEFGQGSFQVKVCDTFIGIQLTPSESTYSGTRINGDTYTSMSRVEKIDILGLDTAHCAGRNLKIQLHSTDSVDPIPLFQEDTTTSVSRLTLSIDSDKNVSRSSAITLINSAGTNIGLSDSNQSISYASNISVYTIVFTSPLALMADVTGVTLESTINAGPLSCADGGLCSVGDTGPAGGKIFYVSGTTIDSASGISSGGIYLEAAPAPVSKNTYNWCEGGANPYTTEIFASATAIGTGAANTLVIINNCTGGAGYQAANLSLNGFSDWFLPSSGEQAIMYNNKSTIGLTESEATYVYAGSTEFNNWIGASLVPWAGVGGQNKGQATPYWPIRAFSPR